MQLEKLKYNAIIFNGNSISDNLKNKYENIKKDAYPYISTKDLNLDYSTISYENGLKIPYQKNSFKIAKKYSTLICIEGGSAGKKIAFLNQDVCFVNKLASIETSQNHHLYFYFVIKSLFFKTQFKVHLNGLIGGVSINQIKNFLIPIYNIKTQIKIANYLDRKTEQIDKAITQKKELIKLLKERQQILINDAITKGIDKTVSMKESGIEWIGKVPKHWEVKKGKYLFIEIDERSKEGKEELLSVSHMTGVTPRSEKNVTMFMSEDYTGSKTCQKDDLVINIMWAWMGALGVSDREGIVSSSYGIYRQQESNTFNSLYLEYLLRTNDYIAEYNRRSTGLHVSRLRLYSDKFLDMKIAVPPIEEQNDIINFIKENNSKIDKAVNLQEQQIERLKELKETLIDSCVTGKVKVP